MTQILARDREEVRELAHQVGMLASSDEYEARRERWRAVNSLREPDRAPVWCRPARAWMEILPEASLQCTDPQCRQVEFKLRQHLYKNWVGDDHIIEPWWDVPVVWRSEPEHPLGLETGQLVDSTELGGWRYRPPVRSDADFDRVTVSSFRLDREATDRNLAWMDELLGDILPVRLACTPPLSPSLSVHLERLRGMSEFMLDLAVKPHLVHRLMAKLLEGTLRAMRAAVDSRSLTVNNYGPMFCSEPVNGGPGDGPVKLTHLWAAANSQEFQEVSADMFEEFLLNYQLPILQQYGAVQYGCCEDLTHKIDRILGIPNLRVFVCSAWTDLSKVVEACSSRCAIMWRQKASEVVFAETMAPIEQHLDDGCATLRGQPYQIVLREIETLGEHPARLREWARAAIAAAEKHA